MGALEFKAEGMSDLENAIIEGPGSITFTAEEIEKFEQRFLIAYAKYDEEELRRQAEIMKDASRITIF